MRSFGIDPAVHSYALEHCNPVRDDVAHRLAETTAERFGGRAAMNIGQDQGQFLECLVATSGAMLVVEVGTFTGMSALWLARGLAPGGRLVCFELVDTYLETAIEAWAEAGVADRIEVRIGPAADGVAQLDEEPHIDLAFIDADKAGYLTYLELLLPRMSDSGVIVVDNVLWSGRVVDDSDDSPDTVALREFNDHVAQRTDCTAVMLTIGDGVTMIRPQR